MLYTLLCQIVLQVYSEPAFIAITRPLRAYVDCLVAQQVLNRYQNEGLTLGKARVTVQLVDGAVCGASLKGSCAIEVMGACRANADIETS